MLKLVVVGRAHFISVKEGICLLLMLYLSPDFSPKPVCLYNSKQLNENCVGSLMKTVRFSTFKIFEYVKIEFCRIQ